MNKPAVTLFAIGVLTLSAFAEVKHPNTINLRFAPVEDVRAAVKEKLGGDAAGAISETDARTNTLTLDPAHAQAGKVRDFLLAFDVRQPAVMVHAVITRHVKATATKEAHDEVVARPTAIVPEGKPLIFKVPGQDDTSIELRINSVPAPKQ
jgi:hypothetical protein